MPLDSWEGFDSTLSESDMNRMRYLARRQAQQDFAPELQPEFSCRVMGDSRYGSLLNVQSLRDLYQV